MSRVKLNRKGLVRTKSLMLLGLILVVGLFLVQREMVKEEKVLQVSFIRLNSSAEEVGTCMDRAIQMALRYYGIKVSITQIIANRRLMDYPSFEREMTYYGLKTDRINLYMDDFSDNERIEVAKEFITSKIIQGSPILVGMEFPAHTVLVVGYKNRGTIAVYHDPAGFTFDYAFREKTVEELVSANRINDLWAILKAD